jgi:hypothetical protein
VDTWTLRQPGSESDTGMDEGKRNLTHKDEPEHAAPGKDGGEGMSGCQKGISFVVPAC